MNGWNEYVYEQRESDLNQIIKVKNWRRKRHTFIEKLSVKVRLRLLVQLLIRLYRRSVVLMVIVPGRSSDKLKVFLEKYFGIGNRTFEADP